jgi:uncharacterized membrane protein (TIGR02234 family)
MAEPHADRRRRTFAPVLLLGLAAGALSAVAGTKPWAEVTDPAVGAVALTPDAELGQMPLAGSLSLLVLAAWGVVLVTRGRVRRAVAVVGAVAAVGVLVTVVVGWSSTVADFEALPGQTQPPETAHTGWFWAAAVGAVLSVVATVLAVRLVPYWPAMGSRYDAPAARPAASPSVGDPGDAADGELWRAIDEGRDPTA